jgi:hypothetical protein
MLGGAKIKGSGIELFEADFRKWLPASIRLATRRRQWWSLSDMSALWRRIRIRLEFDATHGSIIGGRRSAGLKARIGPAKHKF